MKGIQIANEFDEIVGEIAMCFREKNDQYATEDDLANFTKGAALLFRGTAIERRGRTAAQYEALKSDVAKHIAHVFNNDINGAKVAESWNDIAVYAIIALIILRRNNNIGEIVAQDALNKA